jgi:hypothetical protein
MGDRKCACGVFVGRSEGKKPLGKSRHGWWTILKWIFKK